MSVKVIEAKLSDRGPIKVFKYVDYAKYFDELKAGDIILVSVDGRINCEYHYAKITGKNDTSPELLTKESRDALEHNIAWVTDAWVTDDYSKIIKERKSKSNETSFVINRENYMQYQKNRLSHIMLLMEDILKIMDNECCSIDKEMAWHRYK